MAILHGSWFSAPASSLNDEERFQGSQFLIWGETWRRIDPSEFTRDHAVHPYAMTLEELYSWLRSLHQSHLMGWWISDPMPTVALDPEPRASDPRGTSTLAAVALPGVTTSDRALTVSLRLPTRSVALTDSGEVVMIPQLSTATDLEDGGSEDGAAPLTLQSWQITALALSPQEAIQLLNALPLGVVPGEESFLGDDLRFWSHVARWHLDLLARAKFLPRLHHQDSGRAIAHWQTLLDSAVDQERLEQFSRQMPHACRAYRLETDDNSPLPAAVDLLLSFLNCVTDVQVRAALAQNPFPNLTFPKDLPLREWLQALGDGSPLVVEPPKLERLEAALTQWFAPIQQHLKQDVASFRTCFYLQPPSYGESDWLLEYFLQSASDPGFLVGANIIWQNPVERLVYLGRTIDRPQETLLAGLGLASRLYPLLEPSLQVSQPRFCKLSPLQVYDFIKNVAWRLQDSGFGVVLPPGLSNQQGWANRLGLSIRAATPTKQSQRLGLQSLLNFRWELTIGGQRLTKEEFDRLVALHTPLVEINGEWVELRPQDIRAAQTFFSTRKEQMTLSLEDALRISTGDTQVIEKLPVLNFEASGALQELISTLTAGNQGVDLLPVPEGFHGELRPYQVRGMSWLSFLERWSLGACLADDMGLGKTIQLIAFLLRLQEEKALTKPVLLVCPTSVMGNWEREVTRFGPSLTTLVHHGDRRAQGRDFARAIQGRDLIITSYALVHRDARELQGVSWQGVVLDEAQNIKNPEAKQSQTVRQLTTQFRIALTGTPVENRLSELWSIMDFLNPGYLGPRNFFQRRFAVPIERYGDTDSLKTLRSLVQPFILRRVKTDRSIIQDLPEKQEMTVYCGLTSEQASLYQGTVDRALADIAEAEGIQRHGKILALLVKLKQICNHPDLARLGNSDAEATGKKIKAVKFPDITAFQNRSAKLQRLRDMMEELLAEGDRALIFTQFAEWGKLMQAYLEQHFQREVLFLYGGSSKKQREEMVDRFQSDPQGPRVFILSLKAGGVGLNLTRANHVFHFDRWWNPAVENQATDRAFRIGQTRNVQVHKFVCTGTLEEKVHELIESKRALAEQIVGTGENWLTELDTDQLRQLLLLDRSAIIDDEA